MTTDSHTAPTYNWRTQAVVAGVINALLNGGFGLLTMPGGERLPLFGLPSVGFDLLAMSFGISFGTALVVTPLVRAEQRRGRLRSPLLSARRRESFAGWPEPLLHRSINLGVLSVLLFAPLPLLGLWWLAPEGLTRDAFVLWKAGFGFVQGAVVTPIIAVAALATAREALNRVVSDA